MLHKIEKLVSIGKFKNYQATGDVSFKKLVLFYGDNGTGKTTLTAVLRSLTQNKPEIISRRLSTNATAAQEAHVLRIDSTAHPIQHTLRTAGWSNLPPEIEIFDAHFIAENIYSGFDFNDEHKKQLYEFVIGAQGVAIKQAIEQNKADKAGSRQLQTNLETQIVQQVGNGLTSEMIVAFTSIPASDAVGVDAKIVIAEAAFNTARSNAVIRSLQTLTPLGNITWGINFAELSSNLQMTTATIQNAVLQEIFERHCSDLTAHSLIDPRGWLQKGFEYVRNKKGGVSAASVECPFCKTAIDDHRDIIKAYALRFDSYFNDLIRRLQSDLTALEALNLNVIAQAVGATKQMNTERATFWAQHITTPAPSRTVITSLVGLKDQLQVVINLVKQKIENPSLAVSIASIDAFQLSLDEVDANIVGYNQQAAGYNAAIATLRAGIQTEQQAETELNRLKRIKQRFVPAIDTLCVQLTAEKQRLRNLDTSYTQLVEQQERAASALFSNYKDRINHYLDVVFKTPFKIDAVSHVRPLGRAIQSKIQYKLTINGNDISFDPNDRLSVKDCLSEGDKSTIALALFLSKIDVESTKANKILVFDDPLSSFDRNRRGYTISLIQNLMSAVKQVIVLSHNEFFLHELGKGVPRGDKKILRIVEDLLSRESRIEQLDLDTLVENDYFKHIKALESFLASPDILKKDWILGLIRNVLEAHIRFKFYRQTVGIPEGHRTFGRLIEELVNTRVVFRADTTPPSNIMRLRMLNGVSWRPHHGEPAPDYTVLGVDPNTISVTELGGFIRDALDLIDNKL
ncbi:MAG: AAA family ATPase [Candidatus Omnitrophica bacterium]|nr:AAA family ATPase [Candidatus Omnitrophota bacterium]